MIRLALLAILALLATPAAAQRVDRTPRTVVMTAFPREWDALVPAVRNTKSYRINGMTFLMGTMAGKPVVLMQSAVSMVNAAMNTQLVLDRFNVRRIVFSGIAGGVDPALIALARKVAAHVMLRRCIDHNAVSPEAGCLAHSPKIVIGGTGVSAGVFADNADFRAYLFTAWQARVLDMESGAVAQVAYANRVPVIVFRSLSDLAGSDAGANQMNTFMTLASANSAMVVKAFVAALPN